MAHEAGQNGYFRQSFYPGYVEVQVMLPFAKQSGVFKREGPYAAVGVDGKVKSNGCLLCNNNDAERNITFSNDDPTAFVHEEGTGLRVVRRFDYRVDKLVGLHNDCSGLNCLQVVEYVNYATYKANHVRLYSRS